MFCIKKSQLFGAKTMKVYMKHGTITMGRLKSDKIFIENNNY